jgi:hypothetical protein
MLCLKRKEIIMKQRSILFLIIMIFTFYFVCLCLPSQPFAFERSLKTEEASPSEIKGTFTLILYGGRYSDDLETIAILDLEEDQYNFEPYAPDFDYTVKKGVTAEKALAAAQKFVSFHASFWRTQLSKILDEKGNIIGFEVRPLYRPFIYGVSDVLEVNYWPKRAGRVKVNIKLIPTVERLKLPGGGDGGGGGS